MTKYFLCIRQDERSKKIAQEIQNRLEDSGIFELDEKNPSLILSIGGDGTLLRAVHQYFHLLSSVQFIGVHSGKLGFFCDFRAEERFELVDKLIQGEVGKESKIHLLEIQHQNRIEYGLNEVRVENPFNTMICNVYIGDELLENYRGNGLNFSTSTGSSAYNRSLKGPLVDPTLETMIMGEVASINHNAYRSLDSFLVLSADKTVRLKGKFTRCLIGYDHKFHNIDCSQEEDEIQVRISPHMVRFLHVKELNYFSRLRKAFVADE